MVTNRGTCPPSSMPLSEKLRIEVFLPDNPHPAYKALLTTFQEEFTTTFEGCTVLLSE